MSKPTKTINPLHFEDLEPKRFEDLSVQLLYRLSRWDEFNHYGAAGSDDGIDIHAVENIPDGPRRIWHIQCKRYKNIGKTELKKIVDAIVGNNKILPDILILVIACNPSKASIEYFKDYAIKKGIKNPSIWSKSVLEAKLYFDYPDLLYVYFGVNLTKERTDKASKIRRNIRLKQRMMKDFKCPVNPNDSLNDRTLGMKYNNYIVHSIDDVYYPEVSPIEELGISPWFKVEPYDFYFNGIEVLLSIVHLLVTTEGWRPLTLNEMIKAESLDSFPKAYVVGRIPYEAIIDYDLDGDEYYMFPHIYCDFKFNSEPYEEIAYYNCSHRDSKNPYPFRYEPTERLKSPNTLNLD